MRVLREEFADPSQLKVGVFTAIDAAHVAEAVFTNVNVFLDQQF